MSEPWDRFVGVVEGGKFRGVDLARLRATMSGLEGKRVEMAIRTEDPARNLPQNAYLHVLCRLVAVESGESLKRMKQLSVLYALGVEDGTEREVISGVEYTSVRHTSDLTKAEASKVIEWLLEKCAFLEIRPPRPDQVEMIA
jgi:hypothetical protein